MISWLHQTWLQHSQNLLVIVVITYSEITYDSQFKMVAVARMWSGLTIGCFYFYIWDSKKLSFPRNNVILKKLTNDLPYSGQGFRVKVLEKTVHVCGFENKFDYYDCLISRACQECSLEFKIEIASQECSLEFKIEISTN